MYNLNGQIIPNFSDLELGMAIEIIPFLWKFIVRTGY
jgi:hypothetical protein